MFFLFIVRLGFRIQRCPLACSWHTWTENHRVFLWWVAVNSCVFFFYQIFLIVSKILYFYSSIVVPFGFPFLGHVIPPQNLTVVSMEKGPTSLTLDFTYNNRQNTALVRPTRFFLSQPTIHWNMFVGQMLIYKYLILSNTWIAFWSWKANVRNKIWFIIWSWWSFCILE